MPLAGMLSAMRELLLDQVEAPKDLKGRCAVFASRFPSLTPEEIEDLAKMPGEKLAIYTQTVFAGERSTLRNHFPVTFALLRRALGENFDGMKLVRQLHAARPWKSYLTKGLASNFAEYLAHDRPDLVDAVPYLPEVARLEMLQLDAARAPDPEPESFVSPSALNTLSVEDLMLKQWLLAPSAQIAEFSFDVISFRTKFYEADRALPDEPPVAAETLAVGARNRRCAVRWKRIERGEFEFFRSALEARSTPFSSEDLAVAYIEDKEGDERELFAQFLEELSKLLENGVLVAA